MVFSSFLLYRQSSLQTFCHTLKGREGPGESRSVILTLLLMQLQRFSGLQIIVNFNEFSGNFSLSAWVYIHVNKCTYIVSTVTVTGLKLPFLSTLCKPNKSTTIFEYQYCDIRTTTHSLESKMKLSVAITKFCVCVCVFFVVVF